MGRPSPEVQQAPPLSPLWRNSADYRRALPVCRTCAVEHKMKYGDLKPVPLDRNFGCQVKNCENLASYFVIV